MLFLVSRALTPFIQSFLTLRSQGRRQPRFYTNCTEFSITSHCNISPVRYKSCRRVYKSDDFPHVLPRMRLNIPHLGLAFQRERSYNKTEFLQTCPHRTIIPDCQKQREALKFIYSSQINKSIAYSSSSCLPHSQQLRNTVLFVHRNWSVVNNVNTHSDLRI